MASPSAYISATIHRLTSPRHAGHEVNVEIVTGKIIDGYFPPTAARLVQDWTLARRAALEENWRRARNNLPLARIVGLDDGQGR
jgi:hypothetical protein